MYCIAWHYITIILYCIALHDITLQYIITIYHVIHHRYYIHIYTIYIYIYLYSYTIYNIHTIYGYIYMYIIYIPYIYICGMIFSKILSIKMVCFSSATKHISLFFDDRPVARCGAFLTDGLSMVFIGQIIDGFILEKYINQINQLLGYHHDYGNLRRCTHLPKYDCQMVRCTWICSSAARAWAVPSRSNSWAVF